MRRAQRAANLRRLSMAAPRVEVEIDALVLYGFHASERYTFGEALTGELERLFAQADLRSSFGRSVLLPVLDAGRIMAPAQPSLAAVGVRAARAVYAGLAAGGKKRQE